MLGKKLELPNSQLQNIWDTLCSWIPGHTLCLAPTRSYWMFLSSHPPSIPAFSRFSSCCQSLSRMQLVPHTKQKTSKMLSIPRAFSPCPSQRIRRQRQSPRVCTQRLLWKTRSGINRTTARGPKSLSRLPRMRTEPCRGWELLQPLTPLQTLPAPLHPGSRRAQGPH